VKIEVTLSDYEGRQVRLERLTNVFAEVLRLLAPAPRLIEQITALHGHKGLLHVTTRYPDVPPLLRYVMGEIWQTVGQEDRTEIEFNTIPF